MRLICRDLASVRGGRPVFAGISFTLEAGRALILEGPNGAGKSTLLRIVAGLLQPEAGAVALEGGNDDLPPGAQCHYVGHLDAVKPALTVRENLEFWTACLAGGATARALAAFRLGHLTDLPAACLSAGQKRRLALCRLAAADRPLWLLDEPTVSLDRAARSDLAGLCASHLGAGGLIVVATHAALDLDAADTLTLAGDAP